MQFEPFRGCLFSFEGNALWLPKLYVIAIKHVLAARIINLKPNIVFFDFGLKRLFFAFNKIAERVECVPFII